MIPSENRFETVVEMAKDYRIDGAVSEIIHHCAPYANDQPFVRRKLEEMGVPVLELDVDYGTPGSGQIRTRVQAFFEMLEGKKTAVAR